MTIPNPPFVGFRFPVSDSAMFHRCDIGPYDRGAPIMTEERFTVSRYRYLEMTIEYVFRANFTDSYYLETVYVDLSDLDKGEPVWVDPYNGRSKVNDTQIALISCSDEEYTILERRGDTVKESNYPMMFDHICCEDYNDSMLLASNIRIRAEKKDWA